jgi:hypothetical protein
MTITSTGPSGFHLRPLVSVFAVAAIAAGIVAIVQVTSTDSPQTTPVPAEVSTEAVEPSAGPNGLAEALADGKLDAGLTATESQPLAGSAPVPKIVVVEGNGGLRDALVEGKLTMDNPGVQYAASVETAAINSGLRAAFDAGKFDEGVGDESAVALSPPAAGTPTISGGHQK